jgi:transglutaminase-like putative cysteine protease
MTRPRHLIAAAFGILLLLAPSLAARTIYGDREPVELLYPERPQAVEGWSGMYFDAWGENQDAAIFVHVAGDSMSNMFSLAAYGMNLRELDRRARDEGVVFFWNEDAPNPALAIAARDLEALTDALKRNRGLRTALNEIWHAEEDFSLFFADDSNTEFQTSGHEPIIYAGLFTNPDYSDAEALLAEDAQTRRTDLVMELADLINHDRDRITIREIYNLIQSRVTGDRPQGFSIFESTANGILATGVATGCTDYAVAFATLARAKGIPAVIVDSAQVEWIQRGARLNQVSGHFFVEVQLGNEWFLVDSTSGEMYIFYDRENWVLPSGYVAFSKALSVIDTGATEQTHNTLQRVAFWGKEINYREPDYARFNLRDPDMIERFAEQTSRIPRASRPDNLQITTPGRSATLRANPQEAIPGM